MIDTKHCDTISTAIDNNRIYHVQILSEWNDGSANRSVTSTKSLLLHYETIAGYAINGVKEGVVVIFLGEPIAVKYGLTKQTGRQLFCRHFD